MARSRGPARPAARPAPRPAAPAQQSRPASTAAFPTRAAPPAAPPAAARPPAAAPTAAPSQGPGLFGQMASTAAGVAVGSTIGHTLGAGITSMFGGSSAPAEPLQAAAAPADQQQNSSWQTPSCEADARNFTKCLDDNQGNMQICSWYLEQLKACQSMAKQY